MSGWSSPFAKWVINGWATHSKAVNGAEVAARLRTNILGGSLGHSAVAASKSRSLAATTSGSAPKPVAAAKKAAAKRVVAKKIGAKRTATKATGTAGPSARG
jgi:hypothetical protein